MEQKMKNTLPYKWGIVLIIQGQKTKMSIMFYTSMWKKKIKTGMN